MTQIFRTSSILAPLPSGKEEPSLQLSSQLGEGEAFASVWLGTGRPVKLPGILLKSWLHYNHT